MTIPSNLRIEHLINPEQFETHRSGIQQLLALYSGILMDDFSQPSSDETEPNSAVVELLSDNTQSCLPRVWIITDEQRHVAAIATLSHVIPGRHAFIHGVTHPAIRKQPIITHLAHQIFHYGFGTLGLLKIKAEFEADNRGATGFCRRLGFVREALFRQDNSVDGKLRDVAIYSLFSERFYAVSSYISAHKGASICLSDEKKTPAPPPKCKSTRHPPFSRWISACQPAIDTAPPPMAKPKRFRVN